MPCKCQGNSSSGTTYAEGMDDIVISVVTHPCTCVTVSVWPA